MTDYVSDTNNRMAFQRNGLYLDYTSSHVKFEIVAYGPGMESAGCSEYWCPLLVSSQWARPVRVLP
jgi:hypothetical protein